jgi:hypothetical protein
MKKLKPHTVDWAQIERFVASAEKKLTSAHKILAVDEEACLASIRSDAHRGFVSQHVAKQALQAASDYLAVVRADIIARKP